MYHHALFVLLVSIHISEVSNERKVALHVDSFHSALSFCICCFVFAGICICFLVYKIHFLFFLQELVRFTVVCNFTDRKSVV